VLGRPVEDTLAVEGAWLVLGMRENRFGKTKVIQRVELFKAVLWRPRDGSKEIKHATDKEGRID